MCSVEVIDGVHRVELDLRQVFVANSVELRCALAGRRPRHLASPSNGEQMCRCSGVLHTTNPRSFSMLIQNRRMTYI